MSLDELQVTLEALKTVMALLSQSEAHVIHMFGGFAAPRFPLERARRGVAEAIRLINKRTEEPRT